MLRRSRNPALIRKKAAEKMACAPHLAHLYPLLTRSSHVLCSRTLKTDSPFSGREPLDGRPTARAP